MIYLIILITWRNGVTNFAKCLGRVEAGRQETNDGQRNRRSDLTAITLYVQTNRPWIYEEHEQANRTGRACRQRTDQR